MVEEREIRTGFGPGQDRKAIPFRFGISHNNSATHLNQNDSESLLDEEELGVHDIVDEDAHFLVGVSISREATRLLSPMTPAAEKAAAMDDLEGGGYFQSDEDITPPPEPPYLKYSRSIPQEEYPQQPGFPDVRILSLGKLPSPKPLDPGLPSPWTAGPKPLVVERAEETQSVLRGALNITKPRSLSGGADALKKLLPSMPKAGSFIPSMPSTSFFSSSSGNTKNRARAFSLYNPFASTVASSRNNEFDNRSQSASNSENFAEDTTASPSSGLHSHSTSGSQLPALRRVASDDSLLYHSLSRASSLGDDTRFEHHREMVNSRVKAIRDSLQDRSSFKLPAMPSMPRVLSFSFAINFPFNMNSGGPPVSWKVGTDSTGDIMPGNAKKRLSAAPNPAVTPEMVGASVSRPEAAIDSVRPVAEGTNDGLLERAIADLTGDIVIMGGYRGSILRSAKPPHRQLWVPVKVGLNIRKVNLEVGLEPEDEERMEEHIFASGMIQNIGPVDISKRLFKRLRECENAKNGRLRIWNYGYDWRLSPHLLSKKLIEFMKMLPSNQPGVTSKDTGAVVIAHSLGGLVTRHAVNQRPELFSGVVYAGVPQACVNILGPIRNGDAVLLSSRVLTAQVNFTFRTSFVLLPLGGYCFMDKTTREEYPVDFFNADDWVKYRWSPCTDPPLPPKSQPAGSLANILKQGSLANLQLPGRRFSNAGLKRTSQAQEPSTTSPVRAAEHHRPHSLASVEGELLQEAEGRDRTLAPQMEGLPNPVKRGQSTNSSVSTAVTIPRDKAISYLRRTLAEVKQFKLELVHNQEHEDANRYPPFAIMYGKSVPTVYAARVDGRDGIACADSYDNLAFASGDGVCLSREAMLPDGYHLVKGGRVSSDRGHVTLLGDLNAVGRALQAIMKGRAKGIGLEGLGATGKKHNTAQV
jgi:pimeloyl-ACP methyl ester carboxylesterase